ncbi:MAG: hypothetical protein IMZ54_06220 [Acidobacteria bacterium]|nr:hypothetical protein [Spirochaetota bacterium]MBE3130298.1 hypothetical protein [Acidobacteriota bacterium]
MSEEEHGKRGKPPKALRIAVLVVLLGFVAASVGYLVFRQFRPLGSASAGSPSVAGTKTVVYYFYTNARCASCRQIEAWTQTVLEKRFAPELADGRLEWKPVNVEEAANAHFIKDFQLRAKTVVVCRVIKGKTGQWVDLIDVWKYLADPTRFSSFVEDHVRKSLVESGG